jgi:hypothetical protein
VQRQEPSTRQAGSASTSARATSQARKRQATASQDTTVDIHAHGRTWPRDQVPGVLEGGRGVEHSTFRPTRGPQGLNRHSGYLLEDSTASNRRNVLLLKTPSTESTILRARGCFEKLGTKTTNSFVREKLVLHYQGTTFKSRSDFLKGSIILVSSIPERSRTSQNTGFLDSRAFENITEYFDSHITQNLKGTRFILGKKAQLY